MTNTPEDSNENERICSHCGYQQDLRCVQFIDWGSRFLCKRCHRSNECDNSEAAGGDRQITGTEKKAAKQLEEDKASVGQLIHQTHHDRILREAGMN